jgi:hypothetical protein
MIFNAEMRRNAEIRFCNHYSPALYSLRLCVLFLFLLVVSARAAEQFGDISIDPNAIYTGNTFHGYAEMRVILENHSAGKTHVVTLIFPNQSYGNVGNSINRLSRTVKLEPGARETVSLFQPPLPTRGDGSIRVEVDNRHEGEVRAPNANNHMNTWSRGGSQSATVFVSRSLDFDAVQRLFQANHGAFTAEKAVGPPDAGYGGYQPNAWTPDTRRFGVANWIELDYAMPTPADKISIYDSTPFPLSGQIILTGVSGTNLAPISMSSGKGAVVPYGGSRGRSAKMQTVFSFPETSEPIKTIRLDFGTTPPSNISVDAVEISGPTGTQWASDARASSDNTASAGSYAPGSVSADSIQSLRAESPVSEWSENWLAYSPFDAVVLNAADMSTMSPAVVGAIGDYLSAGGNVILSGKTDLPAAWHPSQKQNLREGIQYTVGFGDCFVLDSEIFPTLDPQSVKTLRNAALQSARYWQSLPSDSAAANAAMPVIENLKVPVRGIVVIMLAFIIVIGPVNIILLGRRKRRTWMLWTIPAISFATTLLVFAYSLLREGITPDTRIAGLTVIDQASHHAITIGATAFYCPLTPGGGLQFDYETEATPLVLIGYGSGTARDVDWTQSQHLERGWISARVPVHFHIRKPETRRERIQVVNENGKMEIINGLGAPIKSLWITDADMNFYEVKNVAAGQKASLILSKQSQASDKSGATGLLHGISFAAHADALGENAAKYLLPNTYIAVLDGNPFIENALGSASSPKRTKCSAVVFGILEKENK